VRSAERADSILDDPVSRVLLAIVRSRLQVAQKGVAAAVVRVSEEAAGVVGEGTWLAGRLRLETGHLRLACDEPESALAAVEGLVGTGVDAEVALIQGRARLRLGDERGASEALAEALDARAPVVVQVPAWVVECGRQLRASSTVRARDALETALRLAATCTLRRPFHEAPAPVRQLLAQNPQLAERHAWIFDVPGAALPRPQQLKSTVEVAPRTPPIEALTPKELEVLGHLAEMLTTEEIASAMYISVNTVRTHVRNILRKLGVSRRQAAVRAARELDLLRPDARSFPIPPGEGVLPVVFARDG
jgi:LuxR family maltose regulon positive regulatory protein